MRKVLALAGICATALVVAVSPANTAKIDDTNGGPVCADITNNSGISDYSNGTLTFVLGTTAPSCRGITYTVSAYDDSGNRDVLLGTGSAMGNKTAQQDGSGFVFVTVQIDTSKATTQDSFCIVATSSDDRVFDRAPDTGCISFPVNASGGQTGFE
ncbi:MAG: hypothetical protein C5B48_11780 [Candidatus Rokuibacteriota bacterium]|nr:MAG: hypothetical protein C5B48_11780 [Candidatus Rokubacteria bacterium]